MSNPITRAIEKLKEKAVDQTIRLSTAESNINDYEEKLRHLERNIQMYHEARQVFIESAKISRQKMVAKVEHNLTAALRAIFLDPSMEFKIDIHEKRSVLQAEFMVAWDTPKGRAEQDPLVAKGGSVVDVVTTGLRLVFLKSHQPAKRPILMLDEPGKYLDVDRRERYGNWIAQISHQLGIQVVMVTHDPELKAIADRTFLLRPDPKNGVVVTTIDGNLRSLEGYGFSHHQGA